MSSMDDLPDCLLEGNLGVYRRHSPEFDEAVSFQQRFQLLQSLTVSV